jgi:hypothetical protein
MLVTYLDKTAVLGSVFVPTRPVALITNVKKPSVSFTCVSSVLLLFRSRACVS